MVFRVSYGFPTKNGESSNNMRHGCLTTTGVPSRAARAAQRGSAAAAAAADAWRVGAAGGAGRTRQGAGGRWPIFAWDLAIWEDFLIYPLVI